MKQGRTIGLATVLMISYVGALLFLCLHNFSSSDIELPGFFLGIPMDKIAHFLMFLPFCFMAWFLACYSLGHDSNPVYAAILLLGLCFASLTEAMQDILTETRCAQAYDLLSDSVGISLGMALVLSLKERMACCVDRILNIKR